MTHHVVMWSGGITSWATARHVINQYGQANTTLLFADTRAEDADLHRWNDDAARQLGMGFFTIADQQKRDPWKVFEDASWIGNTRLAQCAHILKQIPTRKWLDLAADPADTILYLGIDWSEMHRIRGVRKGYAHTIDGCEHGRCAGLFDEDGKLLPGPGCTNLLPVPWQVEFPLTNAPYRDKQQLMAEARAAGLEPPRLYALGFAHNNCGGACVKGGQAQWTRLMEVFPERYAKVEAFEQRMRNKLGKDVSILRDRTGGTTTPLTLAALRTRIEEQPEQLDLFDEGGCGCFTTESPALGEAA